jgi:hypothetical protein
MRVTNKREYKTRRLARRQPPTPAAATLKPRQPRTVVLGPTERISLGTLREAFFLPR